jgi:hypothetical protein
VRDQNDDLRSTRRAHTYYPVDIPELAERMEAAFPVQGFYTYLLHQDLDHVLPYTLGRYGGRRVHIVGPEPERSEPLIAAALSRRGHPSLPNGVRDFVSSTAQHLVLGGPCTYEIDFLYPSGDEGTETEPQAFRLHLITPGTLGLRDGAPIQYVPPEVSSLRDPNGLPYVLLEPSTLVRFALPKDLETPVREMVHFLRTANLEQGKDYALMEQPAPDRWSYEFAAHRAEKAELFARVTAPVGWNTRELFKENQLEPFGVWRQLRFLEFKVRVRDSILYRLNEALKRVGQTMGFQAGLQFEGLPTLEEVEEAKNDFWTGHRAFRDLVSLAIGL